MRCVQLSQSHTYKARAIEDWSGRRVHTVAFHDLRPGIFIVHLETRTPPSSGAMSAQLRLKYRCREAAHLLLLHAVGRVAGTDNLRISVVRRTS